MTLLVTELEVPELKDHQRVIEEGVGRMPAPFPRPPADPRAYLVPAAAAAAFSTWTLICFGLASSRFGMLKVNTPFL